MTMTPYDQRPTDDTPTIHAWDPTEPAVGDGAWHEVTDPAEIARLDAALAVGAVGDVYVAYDHAYEVWIVPEGGAALAPDGWTIDDGYMHDPALPPPDLHLSPEPEEWAIQVCPTPRSRSTAASLIPSPSTRPCSTRCWGGERRKRMVDRITRQDTWIGQHGRLPGSLAYTVDGQGLVRAVCETTRAATDTRATVPARATPPVLLCPLTWEPLHRLLAWGAREGMTAADLLDACRAGASRDGRKTANGRGSTWR